MKILYFCGGFGVVVLMWWWYYVWGGVGRARACVYTPFLSPPFRSRFRSRTILIPPYPPTHTHKPTHAIITTTGYRRQARQGHDQRHARHLQVPGNVTSLLIVLFLLYVCMPQPFPHKINVSTPSLLLHPFLTHTHMRHTHRARRSGSRGRRRRLRRWTPSTSYSTPLPSRRHVWFFLSPCRSCCPSIPILVFLIIPQPIQPSPFSAPAPLSAFHVSHPQRTITPQKHRNQSSSMHQTVENIFDLSFLCKERQAALALNEVRIYTVCCCCCCVLLLLLLLCAAAAVTTCVCVSIMCAASALGGPTFSNPTATKTPPPLFLLIITTTIYIQEGVPVVRPPGRAATGTKNTQVGS